MRTATMAMVAALLGVAMSIGLVLAAVPGSYAGPNTVTINGQGAFTAPAVVAVSGLGTVITGAVATSAGPGAIQFDTAGWSGSTTGPNAAKFTLSLQNPAAASIVNPATGNTVPLRAGAVMRVVAYDGQARLLVQISGTFRDGATVYTFWSSLTATAQ